MVISNKRRYFVVKWNNSIGILSGVITSFSGSGAAVSDVRVEAGNIKPFLAKTKQSGVIDFRRAVLQTSLAEAVKHLEGEVTNQIARLDRAITGKHAITKSARALLEPDTSKQAQATITPMSDYEVIVDNFYDIAHLQGDYGWFVDAVLDGWSEERFLNAVSGAES